jgi:hypothetical protein
MGGTTTFLKSGYTVAAKFKCPYLCKVEMSVVVVRWECGNRRSLAISKDCGKSGRTDGFIVWSPTLSIKPSFPPLLIFVRVFNNLSSHCLCLPGMATIKEKSGLFGELATQSGVNIPNVSNTTLAFAGVGQAGSLPRNFRKPSAVRCNTI